MTISVSLSEVVFVHGGGFCGWEELRTASWFPSYQNVLNRAAHLLVFALFRRWDFERVEFWVAHYHTWTLSRHRLEHSGHVEGAGHEYLFEICGACKERSEAKWALKVTRHEDRLCFVAALGEGWIPQALWLCHKVTAGQTQSLFASFVCNVSDPISLVFGDLSRWHGWVRVNGQVSELIYSTHS